MVNVRAELLQKVMQDTEAAVCIGESDIENVVAIVEHNPLVTHLCSLFATLSYVLTRISAYRHTLLMQPYPWPLE